MVLLLCSKPCAKQPRVLKVMKNMPLKDIMCEGENADKHHFLLFQQCFLPYLRQITTCNLISIYFDVCQHFQFGQAFLLSGKVLLSRQGLTLYHTTPTLTTLKMEPVENIVGKGENAGDQHFHLFPQCFLPIKNFYFQVSFILSSASASNLYRSKKMPFGEE